MVGCEFLGVVIGGMLVLGFCLVLNRFVRYSDWFQDDLGPTSDRFRSGFGPVSDRSCTELGSILERDWTYFGHVLDRFWVFDVYWNGFIPDSDRF